jgi:hypothetical protein
MRVESPSPVSESSRSWNFSTQKAEPWIPPRPLPRSAIPVISNFLPPRHHPLPSRRRTLKASPVPDSARSSTRSSSAVTRTIPLSLSSRHLPKLSLPGSSASDWDQVRTGFGDLIRLTRFSPLASPTKKLASPPLPLLLPTASPPLFASETQTIPPGAQEQSAWTASPPSNAPASVPRHPLPPALPPRR